MDSAQYVLYKAWALAQGFFDMLPFGLFANVFGVGKLAGNDYAYAMVLVVAVVFWAVAAVVMLKALNLPITVEKDGRKDSVRMLDVFFDWLLGKDTLGLAVTKVSEAASAQVWKLMSVMAVAVILYFPADIWGTTVSTVGGFREANSARFSSTLDAFVARGLTSSGSAFSKRKDCFSIKDAAERISCEEWASRTERSFAELRKYVVPAATDGADVGEILSKVSKEREEYAWKVELLKKMLSGNGKLTTSMVFDSFVSGNESSGADGDSSDGRADAERLISAGTAKVEVLDEAERLMTGKDGNPETPANVRKKLSEFEAGHSTAVSRTDAVQKAMKASYKSLRAGEKDFFEAYFAVLDSEKVTLESGSVETVKSSDRFWYAFGTLVSVILIGLGIAVSSWKSLVILSDIVMSGVSGKSFIASVPLNGFSEAASVKDGDGASAFGLEGEAFAYSRMQWTYAILLGIDFFVKTGVLYAFLA